MTALLPLVGIALSSCFSPPPPEQAVFTCAAAGDCPAGLTCAEEVGVCVPPEVLALPGPGLAGETVISPALARAGVVVGVTFVVDQDLARDPLVSLEGSGLPFAIVEADSDRAARRYSYALTVDGGAPPDGAVSLIADVTSRAGRPAVLRLGSVTIDRTPNRIDGALAVSGAVAVGGTVELDFAIIEAVDEAHRPRVFFADDVETPWIFVSDDGNAFSFRYTVPDPPVPGEGSHEVRVVLLDNAGNVSAPIPAGVILVDATPPALIEQTVTITAAAGSGANLLDDDVGAAGPGATVTASFTTDEPLGESPGVVVTCGGAVAFALDRRQNETATRFFTYSGVVPAGLGDGACTVQASLTDEAGNVAVVDVGDLAIDVTPPPPVVDALGAGATLARAPWGGVDLDGDDEDDRGARLLVDDTGEAGVVVVAFDPSTGGVLGRAPMGEALDLGGLDRREVEVAAVDRAGNVSARRRVLQGLWVASFGDKVPGSLAENPHRAVAHRTRKDTLDSDGGEELGAEVSAVDGVTGVAAANLRWTRVDFAAQRLSRDSAAGVWDDARGVGVAFGGAANAVPSDETFEYDGLTWTEVARGARPPARIGAAMAFDSRRGVAVMFGGDDIARAPLGDTWDLDGVWRERAVAGPPPRRDAVAAFDPVRDVVVLFGGRDDTDAFLADTWVFDGTTWTDVTPTGAGPPARGSAGMAFDPIRQRVVMFGGQQTGNDTALWAWDGAAWSVVALSGTPSSVFQDLNEHRLIVDPVNDDLLVIRMNTVQQFDTEVHRISSTAWTTLNVFHEARAGAVLFFDTLRDEAVLAGGISSDVTELLPASRGRFVKPGVSPGVRSRQAAAFDPNLGAVIVSAGRDQAVRRTDTFAFDGRRFATTSGVLPNIDGMTALTVSNGVLGFGGVVDGVGFVSQLRRWNGSTWSNVAVSGTVPSGREEAGFAAGDSRGTFSLVFGGQTAGGPSAETFTLTGTVWARLSPRVSPPARSSHVMVFDPGRDGVVLFGGDSDNNASLITPLEDTWLFKDGAWTDISNEVGRGSAGTGPRARARARMTIDPVTGRPLLFGGETALNVPNNELWELDAGGWRQRFGEDPPAPAGLHNFVADPGREHVMLSGGTLRDEAFVLDRAAGGHPAIRCDFELAPIGLAGVTLDEIEAVAVTGGSGAGATADGVDLAVWQRGAWNVSASHQATATTPATLASGALDPFDVTLGRGAVAVALSSRGENAADSASLVVDSAILRVRYRLGGAP